MKKSAKYIYPIAVTALLLLGATTTLKWYAGYGISITKDSGITWKIDTMLIKQPGGPLRWFWDSNKVSIGSSGRTYVRDAEALAGTIDSSGALYTLHYSLTNSIYGQALVTFSNGASDSAVLTMGPSTNYLLLTDGYFKPERFTMLTDVPSSLVSTFDPLNSAITTGDSLVISAHLVNSGGLKYITLWKHKLTDVSVLNITTTTAGFMILKQQISVTFKTTGTSTSVRWGYMWNRRQR